MNKIAKYSAITLLAATTGLTAIGASAGWGGADGDCNRKDMGDRHTMMKTRMEKRGPMQSRDLNLTAEKVKILASARLIMRGNDRLKVGKVVETEDGTFLVDIVTVDDSLVRQIEIDKEKGFPRGPKGPKL
jgi:hypothetical protein